MMDLQDEFNLSILFIAHDLSVVKHISNRVGVMYNGELVEIHDTSNIFNNPEHNYTKELLRAIPQPDPQGREERKIDRLNNQWFIILFFQKFECYFSINQYEENYIYIVIC